MTDIKLKISEKGISLEEILETQKIEFENAIKNLAHAVHDAIVTEAQNNLIDSRLDYIKSMKFEDLGNLYIISIEEPGLFYEDGFGAFDQKPGLLAGPRAKVSKSGHRYNIIPFSHSLGSKSTEKRGEDYKKQLTETISKMVDVPPKEIRDRSGRVVGHVTKVAAPGTQGVTSGLIEVTKEYSKKTQKSYQSFRVVSDKSNTEDWLHPGFSGLKAFDKVERTIDEQIDTIIDKVFQI